MKRSKLIESRCNNIKYNNKQLFHKSHSLKYRCLSLTWLRLNRWWMATLAVLSTLACLQWFMVKFHSRPLSLSPKRLEIGAPGNKYKNRWRPKWHSKCKNSHKLKMSLKVKVEGEVVEVLVEGGVVLAKFWQMKAIISFIQQPLSSTICNNKTCNSRIRIKQ